MSTKNHIYLDRLVCSTISEYLGEYNTLKSLDRVCENAHGHVPDRDNVKALCLSLPNIAQHDIKFRTCCEHGVIDLAQKYYRRRYRADGFAEACLHGREKMARWLYHRGTNIHEYGERAFIGACTSGNMTIVKWLHDLGAKIHVNNDEAFIAACKNGRLEVAQWLYDLGARHYIQDDMAFKDACIYGHLDVVQWLYGLGVHRTINCEYAITHTCSRGHFDVVKWAYDLPELKYMNKNTWITAFANAANGEYFDIAEWISSVHLDGVIPNLKWPFYFACMHQKMSVIKWYYEKGANTQEDIDHAFLTGCERNNEELIRWAYSLGANIHYRQGYNPFMALCEHGNKRLAEWLISLGVDVHSGRDISLYRACTRDNLDIAKWLI